MEPPLKNSAMTLFLFQILVFCSEVVYTLVPDADQVAKDLKVSHFDCGAMTENTLYALNQVRQCHITPEELEIARRNSFSILNISGRSSTQPNAEFNTNERNGTADITTTVAFTTLLPE